MVGPQKPRSAPITEPIDLSDLLACPRCGKQLQATDEGHRCSGCRAGFPSVDGIPWLFAEPSAALGEWRNRLHFSLQRLEHDRAQLDATLGRAGLGALTLERLRALAAATRDHAERLRTVLAPLELGGVASGYETNLALRTRLPADQGLTTYYHNVHRDWFWGEQENEASFSIVGDALAGTPPGNVLVLGAGAGRLAYDIHMRTAARATVALDFNPLLLLVAQRVTRGEEVLLYEFPIAPRSVREQAVLRRLSAPEPARGGLRYVLADAHRPPFRPHAFNVVVTPWLVDILPERFERLCARINVLLADGGCWLNFGSLSFHDAEPELHYGIDECIQALTGSGFAPVDVGEREIPYMCSPASRHGRRETLVTWAARKRHAAGKAPRHEALPEWLVSAREPVPLLDSFRLQAVSTRVHAFLMSLIDGRRSIEDMVALVAEQKLMARDEAEPAIRSFLIKMYDGSRRGAGYQ